MTDEDQRTSKQSPHARKRRVCVWTPIEEDSPVYTPSCPDGEEWQLDEGCELYPFCHWCGGRIKVGEIEP